MQREGAGADSGDGAVERGGDGLEAERGESTSTKKVKGGSCSSEALRQRLQ